VVDYYSSRAWAEREDRRMSRPTFEGALASIILPTSDERPPELKVGLLTRR
jgi:hypothetical protein